MLYTEQDLNQYFKDFKVKLDKQINKKQKKNQAILDIAESNSHPVLSKLQALVRAGYFLDAEMKADLEVMKDGNLLLEVYRFEQDNLTFTKVGVLSYMKGHTSIQAFKVKDKELAKTLEA